ncbi:MAG: 30S ribosomal protein S6e [Candidatus Methanomethylicota archaeon]|uniref:Small ribosomal subunit protein eS6 n=1 Tax=Thermoproteota archaeon TaxID=2056631 RepID=A0A497ETA7_9CREN|nr:MAG: 30S ribosomal protein S6e [Candidatus Verstraetearchaeota archaeon]RLE53139.1 MAG: 30S ribosomal protein S6e [Candidatus Verstraetearchaeota archaeon]
MPEFKLVLSDPTTGKATQLTVSGEQAQALIGLRIGDEIDGSIFGYPDKKIKITGGTDRSGIPMRPDIPGGGKRYVLLASPPGYRPKRKGERRRKLVRGNTITEEIVQVNAILVSGAEKT